MHRSRLRAVAGHELRTQVTGAPFVVLIGVLLAATSSVNPVPMIPGADGARDGVRAVVNSPHALAASLAIGALFAYPFFAALMAGFSVTRDREQGMDELLRSTPLTNGEYVLGKCLGVMAALGAAVLLHVVFAVVLRENAPGGAALGPFRPTAYLQAALMFVAPLVVWVAGISFAVGALSRRSMAVYAVPTLLFIVTIMVSWRWRPAGISPALDALLVVVDPTGLRWLAHRLFEVDQGVPYYNTAPIAFDLPGVMGRVVTLLVPAAAVAMVPSRLGERRLRRDVRHAHAHAHVFAPASRARVGRGTVTFRGLSDLVMTSRAPGPIRGTATILAAELREIARHPALHLFGILLAGLVAEVGRGRADPLGGAVVMSTGSVAIQVMPTVTMLLTLFLLFIVVEVLHRDQATRFESIALTMPIGTGALLAGKALAALIVTGALLAACMGSAAVVVLLQPGGRLDAWPLVIVFVGVVGPTLLLWCGFMTAVMAVARQRTTALTIGIAALLVTMVQFLAGTANWATNWPVLGALQWTDFGTFPLDGEALVLNRVLALSGAVLCLVVARRAFARTERDRRVASERRAPRRLVLSLARVVPFLALPVATGGLLAIRVHDGSQGASAFAHDAEYRRLNLSTWGGVVPPVLRHAQLQLSLDPERRQVGVEGTYHLESAADSSLDALPFTIPRAFGTVTWTVDGQPTGYTDAAGLHRVQLTRPMRRGEWRRVGFRYVATIPAGYSRNGGGAAGFVLPVSVVLSTHRGDFLPVPGFDPEIGRTEPIRSDGSDSAAVGFNRGGAFTATVTVRAPAGLTVVGTGVLASSRDESAQTVTTWRTAHPVTVLSLVAGPYHVVADSGVAVYALPSHAARAPAILATLKTARRRYSEWFTDSPWPQLRLTEVPDLIPDATAYPTTLLVTERLGFATAPGVRAGMPFAVVAHEAAHQWWGHLVRAGSGAGTGLLVEGMADYATLLLHDAEFGTEGRRRYAAYLEREYLERRDARDERSVLDARDERAGDATVVQYKGAWVMWMLQQELGDDSMRAGVRRFVEAYRAGGVTASPAALVRTLRDASRDTVAFDRFAAQWFSSVVLPEYRLRDSRCAPAAGGMWQCDARLHNAGTGSAAVDVEARCEGAGRCGGVRRVTVAAGGTIAIAWTQDRRPTRLIVDPDLHVLQRNRDEATVDLP